MLVYSASKKLLHLLVASIIIIASIPVSSYKPDSPQKIGIDDKVAYIYVGEITYTIYSDYKPVIKYYVENMYPFTILFYNRYTYASLLEAYNGNNAFGKIGFRDILNIIEKIYNKNLGLMFTDRSSQKVRIYPLFLIDTFHMYSLKIYNTPYKSNYRGYYTNGNPYMIYLDIAKQMSEPIGIKLGSDHSLMRYYTRISSIAVVYSPTSPSIITTYIDPWSGTIYLTTNIVLSVINNEVNNIHRTLSLNPFELMYLYNNKLGRGIDLLIILSPGAAIDDKIYKNIIVKYYGTFPSYIKWCSIGELFHRAGARTVVSVGMLPDTYGLIYATISGEKYLLDKSSLFPLLAQPWLYYFLRYLYKGYTVEEAAEKATERIHTGTSDYITLLKMYLSYLIYLDKAVRNITDTISNIIKEVENAKHYTEIIDTLTSTASSIAESYKVFLDADNALYMIMSNQYKNIVDNIISSIENNVDEAVEIALFMLNAIKGSFTFDKPELAKLLHEKTGFKYLIIGDGDYRLTDKPIPYGGSVPGMV